MLLDIKQYGRKCAYLLHTFRQPKDKPIVFTSYVFSINFFFYPSYKKYSRVFICGYMYVFNFTPRVEIYYNITNIIFKFNSYVSALPTVRYSYIVFKRAWHVNVIEFIE